MSSFTLVFPGDFGDYEWDVKEKGFFTEARLSASGKHYRLNFYDRVRLHQEIESQLQRAGVPATTERASTGAVRVRRDRLQPVLRAFREPPPFVSVRPEGRSRMAATDGARRVFRRSHEGPLLLNPRSSYSHRHRGWLQMVLPQWHIFSSRCEFSHTPVAPHAPRSHLRPIAEDRYRTMPGRQKYRHLLVGRLTLNRPGTHEVNTHGKQE